VTTQSSRGSNGTAKLCYESAVTDLSSCSSEKPSDQLLGLFVMNLNLNLNLSSNLNLNLIFNSSNI
jgi:hypothetical protein